MFKKSVYNVTTCICNRGRETVKYGVRKDANIMPAYKVTAIRELHGEYIPLKNNKLTVPLKTASSTYTIQFSLTKNQLHKAFYYINIVKPCECVFM